jgi:glycerol-3-phosphate acyltransferase PlsX
MDIQPEAVPGYARMGMAYAEVRGTEQPRVGLLNVGEEPGKGNLLAKESFAALSELPDFAGNVEPAAVLRGDVDVVVTDGFTGNIFLKTLEAMASSSRGAGAALLLGVAGDVLVAHGAARGPEVAIAVRTAADVARARLSQRLGALLQPLA